MFDRFQALTARREDGEGGFTLIELLVVVVIIGILVAIAIPLYLSYRQGAENKSVQSDIRNAVSSVESYYSQNNAYPADLGAATVHTSNGNTLYWVLSSGSPASYTICGTNSDAGKWFTYTTSTGKVASAGGNDCSGASGYSG